jgi:hypothetical protein
VAERQAYLARIDRAIDADDAYRRAVAGHPRLGTATGQGLSRQIARFNRAAKLTQAK